MPHASVTPVDSVFDGLAELHGRRFDAVLTAVEPIERRPEPAVDAIRRLLGDGAAGPLRPHDARAAEPQDAGVRRRRLPADARRPRRGPRRARAEARVGQRRHAARRPDRRRQRCIARPDGRGSGVADLGGRVARRRARQPGVAPARDGRAGRRRARVAAAGGLDGDARKGRRARSADRSPTRSATPRRSSATCTSAGRCRTITRWRRRRPRGSRACCRRSRCLKSGTR